MLSALTRTSRSFSFRLTLWHSALLLVATAALLGATWYQLRQLTITRERDSIELRIGFLAAAYFRGGVEAVSQIVSRSEPGGESVFFVDVGSAATGTAFRSPNEAWKSYAIDELESAPMPSAGETV